jgi:putative membrane protein
MDRRHMLMALAVMAAAPTPALAQANRNASTNSKMGDAEMKHAQQTLTVGSVALETSRIAQKKAQNAWVKKFANYEVAEQETVAEVLKSSGASPAKMDDKHAAMMKKLQDASADAFDREYVMGQIDGHQELLRIQEQYISAGKDVAHVGMAKLARGMIREHLDLLQTIQKDMKGGDNVGRSPAR